jgi:hypothetical protein
VGREWRERGEQGETPPKWRLSPVTSGDLENFQHATLSYTRILSAFIKVDKSVIGSKEEKNTNQHRYWPFVTIIGIVLIKMMMLLKKKYIYVFVFFLRCVIEVSRVHNWRKTNECQGKLGFS